MDKWKWKEIRSMELGGNKNAMAFYEKNDMLVDGTPNHKSPSLNKYKQDLARRVEIALGLTSTPIKVTESIPKETKTFANEKGGFGK